MKKKLFLNLLIVLMVLVSIPIHAEKQMEIEKHEFSGVGFYKLISTSIPGRSTFDIRLDNTGKYPLKICAKYNYRDIFRKKTEVHYINQILLPGNQMEVRNVHAERAVSSIGLKIKLTSHRKKPGKFHLFSPYITGARGTLTITKSSG